MSTPLPAALILAGSRRSGDPVAESEGIAHKALAMAGGAPLLTRVILALHGFNQGVLNVIVGLWVWGWAAHVLGPSVVGRFPPLIPVTGTLLATPVLGEIPSSLQLAGIVLISRYLLRPRD